METKMTRKNINAMNFYWMDHLIKIKIGNPDKKELGKKEYGEIINVFEADRLHDKSKKICSKRIKATQKIHPGWVEWERMLNPKDSNKKKSEALVQLMKHRKMEGPFGKWQYFYESKKGQISMVNLKNYNFDGKDVWEIYAFEDKKLFPDVKRFDTKKDAEKEIRRMLR